MRSLPAILRELSRNLASASESMSKASALTTEAAGLMGVEIGDAGPGKKSPGKKSARKATAGQFSVREAVLKVMPDDRTLLTKEIAGLVEGVRPGTEPSQVSAILGDMVTANEMERVGKSDGSTHPHRGMMLWRRAKNAAAA